MRKGDLIHVAPHPSPTHRHHQVPTRPLSWNLAHAAMPRQASAASPRSDRLFLRSCERSSPVLGEALNRRSRNLRRQSLQVRAGKRVSSGDHHGPLSGTRLSSFKMYATCSESPMGVSEAQIIQPNSSSFVDAPMPGPRRSNVFHRSPTLGEPLCDFFLFISPVFL